MSREIEDLRAEIRSLKQQREDLNDHAQHTAECIWWLAPGFPEAARLHELELDEIKGGLDALSDRIGQAQNDLWEIEGRVGMTEHIADCKYGRNP